MSTPKQQKLAREIVENLQRDKPLQMGEMLESVGYAKSVAEAKPSDIIGRQGVQDALVVLGFTEDKAKSVVAEIMNNPQADPNSRLKAADMTFKVHGSYAPDKSISLNVRTEIGKSDPKRKELVKEFEERLLEQYQENEPS